MSAVATEQHPAAALGDDQIDIAELAMQIADEASAALIQCECRVYVGGTQTWYDLKTCSLDAWRYVDQAVTYLERRGAAASQRLVRHGMLRSVVRFEERA